MCRCTCIDEYFQLLLEEINTGNNTQIEDVCHTHHKIYKINDDTREIYIKYKILSQNVDINTKEINEILMKHNGERLERAWNRGVYAAVSQLTAIIRIKNNGVYLILSFIDSICESEYYDNK